IDSGELKLNKGVYCEKCGKEIKFQGDLVTTTIMFEVVPYHEDCYAKDLKGLRTLVVSNEPINGVAGNITTVIATLVGIGGIVFLEGPMRFAGLLLFLILGYRLYSYIRFEKRLPE
ncbi:MAG: hypothetical protein KKF57_02245, partial [Firmicutes bacterium]|nr:hypothetical protein [Bacillota bacterium]